MGTIATGFANAFVDAANVQKSACRALGTTIEGYFVAPWTFANPGGTTAAIAPATGYIQRLVGKDADTYQMLLIDGYGGIPNVRLRRANGTAASPTAVVSGNNIGEIEFSGTYNTTTYATEAANIRGSATESWSAGAWGCQLVFQTTANTTNTPADAVWIGQDKSLLAKGPIGYQSGVGAGTTVIQGSNRTTGVTINAPTGTIAMVSAAGSTTFATFTVTNSFVAANDVIILNTQSATNRYRLHVTAIAAGSFDISFATTTGTSTDAPVINFAIIKGAVS